MQRKGKGKEQPLTFIALAIGADLVAVEFQKALDNLLVLRSLGGSRASRHLEACVEKRHYSERREEEGRME